MCPINFSTDDVWTLYLWTVSMSTLMSLSSSTSLLEALTVSRLDSSRRPSFSTLRMSSWKMTNNRTDEIMKQSKTSATALKINRIQTMPDTEIASGAEKERRASGNLHLSVSVCVWVQQELDGVSVVWKFGLRQLWSEALQQLGDLLHCHRKRLNGLQTHMQKRQRHMNMTSFSQTIKYKKQNKACRKGWFMVSLHQKRLCWDIVDRSSLLLSSNSRFIFSSKDHREVCSLC